MYAQAECTQAEFSRPIVSADLYGIYRSGGKNLSFFYEKDGEEQDAHYSPKVENKYVFNLFSNMFILVTSLTSCGKLCH